MMGYLVHVLIDWGNKMTNKESFLVLRQSNGISTAHFYPIKLFSSRQKAIKYLIEKIKVSPLNVVNSKSAIEEFLKAPEMLFGKINTWGKSGENENISDRYKIMMMEME